jgi:predicted component of type VI protein secretion system
VTADDSWRLFNVLNAALEQSSDNMGCSIISEQILVIASYSCSKTCRQYAHSRAAVAVAVTFNCQTAAHGHISAVQLLASDVINSGTASDAAHLLIDVILLAAPLLHRAASIMHSHSASKQALRKLFLAVASYALSALRRVKVSQCRAES